MPGVVDIAEGENLVVDPPRLLVQSFNALWSDEVKAQGTTRVTWEIEPVGDSCRLTVVHDQLPESANAELYGGWPMILSGLKTLLETGERSPPRARSCTHRADACRARVSFTATGGPGRRHVTHGKVRVLRHLQRTPNASSGLRRRPVMTMPFAWSIVARPVRA